MAYFIIYKVFLLVTKQFITFHSNRVKCKKINFCVLALAVRRFPQMHEVVGLNQTESTKIYF